MSTEKIINVNEKNLTDLDTSKINPKISTGRVDINHLLARVRKEQQKENTSNFIFFGLFAILIVIILIILNF